MKYKHATCKDVLTGARGSVETKGAFGNPQTKSLLWPDVGMADRRYRDIAKEPRSPFVIGELAS